MKAGTTSLSERSHCERCQHQPLCRGLAADGREHGRSIRIARHDSLYQAGDAVDKYIYSVRSGSFKLMMAAPHGGPQVVGFALPPEFLGLNALGVARHTCDAIALEDSEVCCIIWERHRFPAERQQHDGGLHALLAAEIRREQRAALMLRNTNAGQRMAELLLLLSQRHSGNGYSATAFRLPMSRCDIASYLGVTAECVSRLIVQFKRQTLFELDHRDVTLLDMPALERMVAGAQG